MNLEDGHLLPLEVERWPSDVCCSTVVLDGDLRILENLSLKFVKCRLCEVSALQAEGLDAGELTGSDLLINRDDVCVASALPGIHANVLLDTRLFKALEQLSLRLR